MNYRAKCLGLLLGCLIMCQSIQKIYSQTPNPSDQQPSKASSLPSSALPANLELNKPVERELKGGESHTYTLELKANEFSKIIVEQKGIDVVVSLFSPTGELLREVDSPNGAEGEEPLPLVSKIPSLYKVEIKSLDAAAPLGKYSIKIGERRTALAQDIELVEAETLDAKLALLKAENKFDEALPLGEKALEIRKKIFGLKHPQVATNLNMLGVLHYTKGNFEKAEELYKQVIEIREEVLGKEHPDVAEGLNNLAHCYSDKGDFNKAEPLFNKALAIYQKSPGQEINLATVMNGLGSVYFQKGDYEKAEVLYKTSLQIKEKILGPENVELAIPIGSLGLLYTIKGDYEKAEIFCKKTISLYEKNLGAENTTIATAFQNLGDVYYIKGEYESAETFYRRSLFLKEKILGVGHIETALPLNQLALLYRTYGDYEKAENLYKKSAVIFEKVLGPGNVNLGVSFQNLGFIYYLQTKYDDAESLFKESLTILEKNLGQEHYLVSETLRDLARVYTQKKMYTEAETLYKKALMISEKTLGIDHVDTASIIFGLAGLYRINNQYKEAEEFFKRGIKCYEKIYNPNHPNLVLFNNDLSELCQAKGEIENAIKYKTLSNNIREDNLEKLLYVSSEDQKLKYLSLIKSEMDVSLSLHLRLAPTNEQACKMALTDLLRRKGRSLDATTSAVAVLRNRAKQEDKVLLDNLSQIETQLATISLKGAGKEGAEAYFAKVKALEEKIEDLQKQISNISADFKASIAKITLESVQGSVPKNAALIEFAVYMPYDVKARVFQPTQYVAYILSAEGTPEFVELGDAEAIDQAVLEFRETLIKYPGQPLSNINKQLKPKARAIDKLVMEPVRKLLGDKKHLLIAPDGGLNIVPFDAFVDEKGKYLIENYEITYLTSGRDLIRLQTKGSTKQPSIVVADPDYGNGKGPVLANRQYEPLSNLKATLQEAVQIKKLFPELYVYLGNKATEENIKSIKRPEILHIATHGLFLPDNPIKTKVVSSDGEQRILVISRQDGKEVTREITSQELKLTNPLLRSCLFFSGANQTKLEESQSDGVMTALEVSSLDLFGTKLVVLSACESGLGKIQTGEGVYGLRRALVLAGSETQMISLWAVSDDATKDLMTNYYKALKAGESRGKALREAQLSFLQANTNSTTRKVQTSLRQRQAGDSTNQTSLKKTNLKLAHPYYWASFIQSGEWGTLDGKR